MIRVVLKGYQAQPHPMRRALYGNDPYVAEPTQTVCSPRFGMQDLREFLMAYCACFLAVSAFIA